MIRHAISPSPVRPAGSAGAACKTSSKRGISKTRNYNRSRSLLFAIAGAAAFGLAAGGAARADTPTSAPVATPAKCPWLDPHLPIARRVAMIMRKMTLQDEIGVVKGYGTNKPYAFYMAANPKLCLPALGLEDGPEGVADGLTGVTMLPSGAALAATFSRRLAYRYGQVIGAEQTTKGSSVDLGPTVNIDRDPRWGREFESLSEDPKLAADVAVAEIRGIQSRRIMAQVKHFDAYNQETHRNTSKDDVLVSQRTLHEIYEPAFRAAIRRAKDASTMCAYSTVNGHYSCQSHALLTDVLRDEWNFDGFVTSDYAAIHNISAARAGADQEQPFAHYFGTPLQNDVSNGTIARAVLNTMVEPILYQMFRFHFFDHPASGSTGAVATRPAHRALSTEVAEAGTVLLKNDHDLLPLSKSPHIAVIGPAASAQPTYGGGGSAHVNPSATVTPLAGIEALAGSSAVSYTKGLPTDAQLTSIPAADLSPAYRGTGSGGSSSFTLTAPATGTYVLGITNSCGCYDVASLSVDGRTLINDPGTPPVATYSAAVHLNKGAHTLKIGGAGPTRNLAWATPSTLHAAIHRAVQAAKSARVAVVVVADDTESEGADRPDLRLPSAQNALVSAVARANPRTVVVVQAGAPIAMPWLGQVPAILDTWYSGQTDGTALADVLFGKADPGGHLPVTFPARLADVPAAKPARFPGVNGKVHYSEGLRVGYRWYDAKHIAPMFPFGFGLSYAHFRFSGLHLSRSDVDGVTPVEVSALVTNDGKVSGTDVAQLYLGMPAATGEPPRKLVDFHRVMLAPGQSRIVHFTITPREEWWWGKGGWDETAGTYTVHVGDSSALADLPLFARYRLHDAIGGRQVTVSAPPRFRPGTTGIVTVSLSAGGNENLHRLRLALDAPGGWRVVPLGPPARGDVAPGTAVAAKFAVTPPSWAVSRNLTLYGTAGFGSGACHGGEAGVHGGRPHHAGRGVGRGHHAQGGASADQRRQEAGGGRFCRPVVRHGGVQVRLAS